MLYVGTYTRKEVHVEGIAEGVYLMEYKDDGTLSMKGVVAKIINPTFSVVSRCGKYLFSVGIDENTQLGKMYSFEIQTDYSLKPVNSTVTENERGFCHIFCENKGKYLFVSAYSTGALLMFSIGHEGSISVCDIVKFSGDGPTNRQKASHIHSSLVSKDESTLFVADLGSDKIWLLSIDCTSNKLIMDETNSFTARKGSGPRHLSLHENGKHLFCINELDNTISYLQYDGETLKELSYVSTIPEGFTLTQGYESTLPERFTEFFKGSSFASDLEIHPNMNFLYGSNRGADTISVFEIDEKEGKLKSIQDVPTMGYFPRAFSISKNGSLLFVANQNSDNIVVFSIDQRNGELKFTGINVDVKTPVSFAWK